MSNLKKFNDALARHTSTLSTEDIIVDPEGSIRIEMNNGVATGVKDTPEAAETEAVEATEEVDAAVEDAEETEAAMEGLKILASELDKALMENGGLTVEESDILTKEYLDLLARAKMKSPLCPSMESYGINDFHRLEATKLLRQNVVLSTEGIFETIMTVLKTVWKKIQEAFKNIFNHMLKLTNNLKEKFKRLKQNNTPESFKQIMDKIKASNNTLSFGQNQTGRVINISQLSQIVYGIAGCIDGKSIPPYVSISAETKKLFELEYDDLDAIVDINKAIITKMSDSYSLNYTKNGLFNYVSKIENKKYEIRNGESIEYMAIKIDAKPSTTVVGLVLDVTTSKDFLAVNDSMLDGLQKKINDATQIFQRDVNKQIDNFESKYREYNSARRKLDIEKDNAQWTAISRTEDEAMFWMNVFKETIALQFEQFKFFNMELASIVNIISNAIAAIATIKNDFVSE